MDRFSSVILFIEVNRKTLVSLFLVLGLLSATIDGIILLQRPLTYRSKASNESQKTPVVEPGSLPSSVVEFISPKGWYKLPYDQKQWTHNVKPDETFGSRVIFNLREGYGYARLDIIEGESEKDLSSLKDEIINASSAKPVTIEAATFKEEPSYLLTYKETVLGAESSYYQQIVKSDDKFLIFEKRFPQLGDHLSYLNNLLDGISLSHQVTPQVKGVSEGGTNLATVELVDLVRPSIVSIVHTFCIDIVNLQPALSRLSKDKYNFCGLSKGSGFIVSEKGVIATNGHVAKIYPEEGLVTNLLSRGNKTLATDLIKVMGQAEDFYLKISSNPQYLDHLLAEIFKLLDKKAISIGISDEKFYVNVGNKPVKIDYQKIYSGDINGAIIPSSTTYTADLLDFDYPNKYSYDAIINRKYQSGSDVALLQIKNPVNNQFPVLQLGNTQNLREGSDIVIAGYPILVEGGEGPKASISFKTSTEPTITRGILSAIKQDPSGRTVFQTDASIDQGNSGGPAFNLQGEVIGIATFFFESKSGNFNFLRDVSDLKQLLAKNNIENKFENLTTAWRKGLAQFRQSYYKQAIKYFEEVQDLSPSHPTVKEFIKASSEAIEMGKSLEGLTGFVKSEKGTNSILVIFGGISTVSFMSAGFLTALPFFTKRQL